MKLYKLLKDLPTFEHGDIFELRDDGCLWWGASIQTRIAPKHGRHWQEEVMAYHNKTLGLFPEILEEWFEEIKTENTIWKPAYRESYYYITERGCVYETDWCDMRTDEEQYAIGNCFRSKEEAEKATEKLKALKRLKDKGFKFADWEWHDFDDSGETDIQIRAALPGVPSTVPYDIVDNLNLLFGGNDE